MFKIALTAVEVAQLAAGRYAGIGGYSTVTLGGATTANGAFTLDAGNLNANGNTLTVTAAAAVNTGTYTVASAAQVFSGGLTVRLNGVMTLASAGGSVALGSGTTLTVDGTLNASTTGATITSVSGHYGFKIGSTASATPTLNISGLTVQNTDSNGMWLGVNSNATVTITEFDNLAFSNGAGAQLLQITAGTIYLASSGCTLRRQHHLRRQGSGDRHQHDPGGVGRRHLRHQRQRDLRDQREVRRRCQQRRRSR